MTADTRCADCGEVRPPHVHRARPQEQPAAQPTDTGEAAWPNDKQRFVCPACQELLVLEVEPNTLSKANDRIDTLTKALRKYGRHQPACTARKVPGDPSDCDCGFADALKERGS